MTHRAIAVLCLVVALGCSKGAGTPTSPPPTNAPVLQITRQEITLASNIVSFSWMGAGTTFRVSVGTASQLSNVHTADVTGTTYTWTAPRDANAYYVRVAALTGGQPGPASTEVLVYTVDMRHVIDALYFGSGPMSQSPTAVPGNIAAGIWPDGSVLRVRLANDLGQSTRTFADVFLNDYATATGGAIRATSELAPESFLGVTLSQVDPFNILTRVQPNFCSSGAIACANLGPAPLGSNRSIVTMVALTPGALRAMAHELGHAYGMWHVNVTAAVRAELNFLMNPTLVSDSLTDAEKTAIATARQGGLRAGATRNQALAAGLVAPFSAVEFARAAAIHNSGRHDDQCEIVTGVGR